MTMRTGEQTYIVVFGIVITSVKVIFTSVITTMVILCIQNAKHSYYHRQ